MTTVTLLYFDGCPNWQTTDGQLAELAGELQFTVERRRIGTPQEAEQVGFRGSPTVLVDGVDPFATGDEAVGLSCRVYVTEEGLTGTPTVEQLRSVLE